MFRLCGENDCEPVQPDALRRAASDPRVGLFHHRNAHRRLQAAVWCCEGNHQSTDLCTRLYPSLGSERGLGGSPGEDAGEACLRSARVTDRASPARNRPVFTRSSIRLCGALHGEPREWDGRVDGQPTEVERKRTRSDVDPRYEGSRPGIGKQRD
jgi:hypothetical protein